MHWAAMSTSSIQYNTKGRFYGYPCEHHTGKYSTLYHYNLIYCFTYPDVIHDSVRKRLQYIKTSVQAGNVLKLLAVFEDVSSTQNSALSNKRLSLPLLGRSQNNSRYAQCLNHKNQVSSRNSNCIT